MVADPEGRQRQGQLKHSMAKVEGGSKALPALTPFPSSARPDGDGRAEATKPAPSAQINSLTRRARLLSRWEPRGASEQTTQQSNQVPALLVRSDGNA